MDHSARAGIARVRGVAMVGLTWAMVHLAGMASAQEASTRPELEVQLGHQNAFAHAVFSADSRLLASADIRGSIRIWDTTTGRQVRALPGHASRVTSLAFSPDGRRLASAGGPGRPRAPGGESRSPHPSPPPVLIKIWDIATATALHQLSGHQKDVKDLAFSPDGTVLATAGGDIRIWDAHAGRETERIEIGSDQTTIAFSPDGRVLAIREPPRLRLWTVGRGELASFTLGNAFGSRSVAFRADGARLAVPDGDRLKIIDPSARTLVADLALHHEAQVVGFADAHCVIRSSQAYELWDISTGQRVRALAPREGSLDGRYHALSPDRRRLAALRGGSIMIRDLAWNRPPVEFAGGVGAAGAVAFSPDGRLLAMKSGRRVWVWDLNTGQPKIPTSHGAEVDAVAFADDGRSVISGDLLWNLFRWDAASGQVRNMIALPRERSATVTHACSADGRWCASGQPGRIDIWDVESWRIVQTLPTGTIRGVAISDDGAWVAAARVPGEVELWDRHSGEHRLLAGHPAQISRVAFSPRARLLASADFSGSVRLWETASGREVQTWDSGQVEGITSLAFSPDGRALATGGADETIRLWDVDSGRLRHVMRGHVDWVAKLAFSPNGSILASGSGDGTVRLWDVERGVEMALLTAGKNQPDWLVVTPEGLFDGPATSAETLLAWRVRTSAYPGERYFNAFFRAGLLAAVWKGERPTPSLAVQSLAILPQVRIEKASATVVPHAHAKLRVTVEGPAAEVRLYQNLALIAGQAGVPGTASEYLFEVNLVPGENEIRAVAVSPAGESSHPDAIRLTYEPPAPAGR